MNNTVSLRNPISFLFLVSVLLSCVRTSAPAQHLLTLDDALTKAFASSYTARSAREQLRASEAAAEAARLALYSRVDLQFDLPDYSRTLLAQFNTATGRNEFFPFERTQWSGRIDVTQPVVWTNSTLTLSGLLYQQQQKDFSPTGELFRDWYTDLAIQLRQPLFVPNTQRIALRRAELDFEESMADYVRNTLDLRYTVTEQFYNLYAAQERVIIQQDRVQQEETSFATGQRKYRAGLIAEVEALQFEVDLAAAKNDLLAAENLRQSRADQFKILLGIPVVDSLTCLLEDTTVVPVTIDLQEAIARAKRTRVDLQRARNSIERGELDLEGVQAQRRIRGDLFLSYGLSKNDAEFSGLTNDLRDTRRAVLTVSVPVFDWGKHSRDVEAAEARLRSAQLTAENVELGIEREIIELSRNIASAARRAEVLRQSRLIADIANEISTKRYEVGTIGSTELAQARARLLQARLSALEAVIDYHRSLADMARRTAFDFKRNAALEIPR
ncbi:MAG: TolC family protein [Bacteroidota bacterium]|jgi:outer membrane protein TolC|nr:TolC family protein [Bacteroidota bacterium]